MVCHTADDPRHPLKEGPLRLVRTNRVLTGVRPGSGLDWTCLLSVFTAAHGPLPPWVPTPETPRYNGRVTTIPSSAGSQGLELDWICLLRILVHPRDHYPPGFLQQGLPATDLRRRFGFGASSDHPDALATVHRPVGPMGAAPRTHFPLTHPSLGTHARQGNALAGSLDRTPNALNPARGLWRFTATARRTRSATPRHQGAGTDWL